MGRHTVWALLGLALLAVSLHGQVNAESGPSESECRPYIEKAIHELQGDAVTDDNTEEVTDTITTSESDEKTIDDGGSEELQADQPEQTEEEAETGSEEGSQDDGEDSGDVEKADNEVESASADVDGEASTEGETSTEGEAEASTEGEQSADAEASTEGEQSADAEGTGAESGEQADEPAAESGEDEKTDEASTEDAPEPVEDTETAEEADAESGGDAETETVNEKDNDEGSNEAAEVADSVEKTEASAEDEASEQKENTAEDTKEDETATEEEASTEAEPVAEEVVAESAEESGRSKRSIPDEPATEESTEEPSQEAVPEEASAQEESGETEAAAEASAEQDAESTEKAESVEEAEALDAKVDPAAQNDGSAESVETTEGTGEVKESETEEEKAESGENSHPEEDLLLEFEIPENLRDRDHITELLKLDDVSSNTEDAIHKTADVILKELKKVYDNAIKPLEVTYRYRDLSNRHFGDPEIFSKPLVLFMGPWSGGKSTILNYLTDNEYTVNSLRSGAEPSPAYFNILMHGDEPEVLDGTQLAADWTFSGLQKFGEGMLDRLRGLRLPNKLLEKVNIVEIPGILEVRKQVSRLFPFNDACQWFIDRADIIFLVYDPAKLDVGPETEAILDQLKGREYQTRIVLNKADTVKPEELMRVQGALIWNISPLMSSAQPPVMYTVSLWSHPYDSNAPVRLLHAQERALLRDLRSAIDKRIENKIASARRFAVRVRNHAKMVDCYLTTYYNHKTLFGNKKQISEQIIQNPQNYHIYEGISTLTNISRYDLPDPDVYRDFFRLNPLYEFKKLVETCTYFNGCPINKLDVAIAYDLPELVGKYKKLLETNLVAAESAAVGAKPKS